MPKKKVSSVRHTRSNQVAWGQKPPSVPPEEQTAARIRAVIHPATLAQVGYYQQLGLRERTLTLPLMVALVISLVWRQLASASEVLRVLKTEGLLWANPFEVSQQAHNQRFWAQLLSALPAKTLLLMDLGFTNYQAYAKLLAQQVTLI